jgi:UDP-2,3-diacylglucosamine pyrophosphatase LpxH
MHDAVIISDLHLGSEAAQVWALRSFLELIKSGRLPTREIVLNGDVFDSHDFRRLKKQHWKVLTLLRSISDDVRITWINGNHDGPAEFISSLIGVRFAEEYLLRSGGNRILVLHGHQFDTFIDNHPFVTWAADQVYRVLQQIDPTFRMARSVKRGSKTFLRCSEQIERGARKYAKDQNCDIVCCGHTHLEAARPGDVSYFNSGCWTELPCTYLTVDGGQVAFNHFDPGLPEWSVELAGAAEP